MAANIMLVGLEYSQSLLPSQEALPLRAVYRAAAKSARTELYLAPLIATDEQFQQINLLTQQ